MNNVTLSDTCKCILYNIVYYVHVQVYVHVHTNAMGHYVQLLNDSFAPISYK